MYIKLFRICSEEVIMTNICRILLVYILYFVAMETNQPTGPKKKSFFSSTATCSIGDMFAFCMKVLILTKETIQL